MCNIFNIKYFISLLKYTILYRKKINKYILFYNCKIIIIFLKIFYGDWGLGIGDWGLGIGANPQSLIPNTQSPIPN